MVKTFNMNHLENNKNHVQMRHKRKSAIFLWDWNSNALDSTRGVVRVVAAGRSYVLHVWGIHSHPVTSGFGHLRSQFDSRAKRNGLGEESENMKSTDLIGIVLIVLGALALVYQGFTYTTTKQDAQIGSLKIQHNETQTVPLSPILGVLFMAVGATALYFDKRNAWFFIRSIN